MTARIARLLAAVIALLLSGSATHAQVWTGGLKGGIGQGGFTGSSEFNWNQPSLNAAAFFNHSINDRFGIQPELAYQQTVGISRIGASQRTLTVHYIEAPVLLQYKLPTVAGIMPFMLAGPHVAMSFGCTLKFVGGPLNTSDNCDTGNGTVRSRRFDFGGTVGAGMSWPVGITTFGLEGRASAGLRSNVSPVDVGDTRRFGWSFMVSVSFPRQPGRIARTIPAPVLEPLPPMPSRTLAEPERAAPLTGASASRLISVNAVDTDVRTLLIAIAKEGGINMVVSPDVQARVSVRLSNVPAMEAVRAIVQLTGLSVAEPASATALPAVVFYQLPIDINQASSETIAARFGVSVEMAKWIVENQPGKPPKP